MGWEPLQDGETTLAQILAGEGFHTAAAVDTPFYLHGGMNYDRGFRTFRMHSGQRESQDYRAYRRHESDYNAPQTFTNAMHWLEGHYKEDFFLYVDTWDPHEPWDAPQYYTELYWPGYDGEVITPAYSRWQDTAGFTEDMVRKAHATYCGEITMVDTWIGYLMRCVENLGLMDKTAIIFTSDHGFYFGEHGGLFGKMTRVKQPDGTPYPLGEWRGWAHSPLYEQIVRLPLLMYVPGIAPGVCGQLTSAVDVMPSVLDVLGVEIPDFVQGDSLLPKVRDASLSGREYVVSTMPFSNPGDAVHVVDSVRRLVRASPVTVVTTGQWSLLYSMDEGISELFNLESDPGQEDDVISTHPEVAKEIHQYLVRFMRETHVAPHLLNPRLELRI